MLFEERFAVDRGVDFFCFVVVMHEPRLGEFEILILAALIRLGDGAYGVSVRREVQARTGRSVSIGAVYTTLGRLERKGLVRSRVGAPTSERGGRAKKYFRANVAGRAALKSAVKTIGRMTEGLAWA
jgi:DNA-binding PadR family transcriptional regulator